MYQNCRVSMQTPVGRAERYIWANADKAIVGRVVKILEHGGDWTQPWTVEALVGQPVTRGEAMQLSESMGRSVVVDR